jgi:hypothetical protein
VAFSPLPCSSDGRDPDFVADPGHYAGPPSPKPPVRAQRWARRDRGFASARARTVRPRGRSTPSPPPRTRLKVIPLIARDSCEWQRGWWGRSPTGGTGSFACDARWRKGCLSYPCSLTSTDGCDSLLNQRAMPLGVFHCPRLSAKFRHLCWGPCWGRPEACRCPYHQPPVRSDGLYPEEARPSRRWWRPLPVHLARRLAPALGLPVPLA